MIVKNEKWGDVTVHQIAEMGQGTISVMCGYFPNQKLSYVAFNEQGTGKVGETVPGFEEIALINDTPCKNINFALRFSNTESIQVVIDKLKEAKTHLKRMEIESKSNE